jgi:hypothetical protein
LPINECLGMAAAIDGTSNTMIVSEIANYYYRGGTSKVRGTRVRVDGSAQHLTGNTYRGGRWFVGTNRRFTASGKKGTFGNNQVFNLTTVSHYKINNQARYINFDGTRMNVWNSQGIGQNRGPNHPLLSAHPNAVLAVFMDGHVHTITNNTPTAIVKRLATRDDGQAIQNFQ